MQNDQTLSRATKWLYVSLFLLSAYLLLKYALGIFLPFLIALTVGAAVYPISVKVARLTHLPRKLCACVTVLLLLTLLVVAVVFSGKRLLYEIYALIERASDESDPIGAFVQNAVDLFSGLTERIPFFKNAPNKDMIADFISNAAKSAISSLGSTVTSVLGRAVVAMPKIAIALVVTAISCFYTSCDLDKIKAFFLSVLPKEKNSAAHSFLRMIAYALRAYAKVYLTLFLLTFAEVFIGLLLLRRPYAFLWALLVAIVDILPLFGAGTILLPWSAFLFLSKQFSLGCGLLILYALITIVRQIAEPLLVGKGLGVHPLATLFSIFAGLKLFGIFGLLLAPIAMLSIKEFLK